MRRFLLSFCGRSFSVALCTALLSFTSCLPTTPLEPVAGVPEFQRISVVDVGHAKVNTAGGNLIFETPALVVDTPLGPQSFGATYNAASGDWTFSFYDLFYDGSVFVDPTGHQNSLGYLNALGRPMPLNRDWTPLDSSRLKTAGGMIYEFDPETGGLAAIHRSDATHPRIVVLPDELRQCAGAGSCETLFEIVRDGSGRIVSVKDRPGSEQRTADFAWDAFGRLTTARSAGDVEAGRSGFRIQYGLVDDLIVSTTNSEGERIQYAYDLSRRVTHVTRVGEGDPTTRFVYGTADGLAFTRIIDPLGHEVFHRHDIVRQLLQVTDGEGGTTSYEWTRGRISQRTTAAGVTTHWAHDGDTTIAILPSGNRVTTVYATNAVNRDDPFQPAILSVTDLDEQGAVRPWLENSYDATGRLAATTDGNGDVTSYEYDAAGNLYRTYLPNPSGGFAIERMTDFYGPHGHPTQVGYSRFNVPFTEPQTYTAWGDPTSGTAMDHAEAEGRPNIRRLHYDHDRHLSAIDYGDCVLIPQTLDCDPVQTANDVGTTTITRRSDGRPLTIERPLGNDSEFVYDALGRLIERRDAVAGAWQSTLIAYDMAGRVESVDSPDGAFVAFEYDADGRQTKATWTRPGSTPISRDTTWVDGRVASLLDSTRGALETREYDASGRLAAVNHPGGERIEIQYDGRDRPTHKRLIFPDLTQNVVETIYDAAGNWIERRLDGVPFAEQVVVGVARKTLALGTGNARVEREWIYSHGEGGRVVQTQTRNASSVSIENTDITRIDGYDFDETQIFSAIELASGTAAISETLRERNEPSAQIGRKLVGEGEFEVLPGLFVPERNYVYDALGNLLDVVDHATGFDPEITYNADHSRLVSAAGYHYVADAAGYVDQIVETASGVTTSIERNAQGRPIGLQVSGAAAISFDRDSWGRPLEKLFGGMVELAPGGVRLLDLGDVRLALQPGGCHLGRYFDQRGNVRFTVDLCTGTALKAFEYSAYGVRTRHGVDDDDRSFAGGREVSDELILLGSRLYQPSVGRFLSPDPELQRGSQYAYAEGNPLRLIDADGNNPLAIFLQILIAVAAAAVGAATTVVVNDWLSEPSETCECTTAAPGGSAGAGGADPAAPEAGGY